MRQRAFSALWLVWVLTACGDPPADVKPDAAVMVDAGTPAMLTAFGFLKTNNPDISADVTAEIGRVAVSASVPFADPTALKATFATDGTAVFVDGVPQESGVTPNDFTNPVMYTVVNADGLERQYRVSVASHGFAASQDFMTGAAPKGIAIGDLNGDARPDIVTPNWAANTVSVMFNKTATGSSIASFTVKHDFAFPIYSYPAVVAIGDINGDSLADVVVGRVGVLSVMINTTATGAMSPSFMPSADTVIGTGVAAIEVADLDGDGKLDVAVAEANADVDQVQVLRNTTAQGASTPSFAAPLNLPVPVPYAMTLGDFNGDGRLDIATADYVVRFMFNTTANNGSPSFASPVWFMLANRAIALARADFDGDGKMDVVTANIDGDTASTLRNTTPVGATTPTFEAEVTWPTGLLPQSVATGDFNGDSRAEFVVADGDPNATAGSLSLRLHSTGALAFAPERIILSTASRPDAIAVADLNGDGKPDVAAVCTIADAVSVLLAE